jgi:SAM-dependent methyltransferase
MLHFEERAERFHLRENFEKKMTNNLYRIEPYAALADVYKLAGLAQYSVELAPRLLERAFDFEFTGRTLLDLACGTGDMACWFAEHSFRAVGVDLSPHMLRYATARADEVGLSAEFIQGDIRTFTSQIQFDMVTCLGGSLNYIPALRDLENVFRQAHHALAPGKLFIFDVRTIQGLAKQGHGDQVLFDNARDMLIVTRDVFSYEALQLNREYIVLRGTESGWKRADETHILRGYPVQAIVALLTKAGFKLRQTLNTNLESVDNQRDANQLVFIATRNG